MICWAVLSKHCSNLAGFVLGSAAYEKKCSLSFKLLGDLSIYCIISRDSQKLKNVLLRSRIAIYLDSVSTLESRK